MAGSLRLVEIAFATDTGRIRSHNEDRSLAKPPVLAIADGMGGANAGEVAAEMTIAALRELPDSPSAEQVRDVIVATNTAIRERAEADPSHAGMGTTVTSALIDDADVTILHVGDSRAYVWRDGTLRQLTDDHSMVAELVRQGQLSPAEADRHPARNVITRALGAEATVDVDQVPVGAEVDDVLLICSDGLSSLVPDRDIADIITGAPSLQVATRELIAAALEAGGTDNVTIVLARIGDDTTPAEEAVDGAVTERLAIPAPAETSTTARTPVVLEPTESPAKGRVLRRVLGLGAVSVILLGGLAAWVGSRTYFVDGEPGQTARVYHGAPFGILGIDLYGEWADTGVDAGIIQSADRNALGRSARGQGDAVRHAVDLVWAHGLPVIPAITAPPPTAVVPPTVVTPTPVPATP